MGMEEEMGRKNRAYRDIPRCGQRRCRRDGGDGDGVGMPKLGGMETADWAQGDDEPHNFSLGHGEADAAATKHGRRGLGRLLADRRRRAKARRGGEEEESRERHGAPPPRGRRWGRLGPGKTRG
jgi:hypothetical protein